MAILLPNTALALAVQLRGVLLLLLLLPLVTRASAAAAPTEPPQLVALCISGQLRGAEGRERSLRDAVAGLGLLGTVRAFASVHLDRAASARAAEAAAAIGASVAAQAAAATSPHAADFFAGSAATAARSSRSYGGAVSETVASGFDSFGASAARTVLGSLGATLAGFELYDGGDYACSASGACKASSDAAASGSARGGGGSVAASGVACAFLVQFSGVLRAFRLVLEDEARTGVRESRGSHIRAAHSQIIALIGAPV